jgi:hypothetical protein
MSDESKIVTAIIRVEGGLADDGLIGIHDAGRMITGLARSINIVAHAFANENTVRQRANTADGSQTYIRASMKGCFEEQIEVHFTKATTAKIGKSVIANQFWDYLTWSWKHTLGKDRVSSSRFIDRIMESESDAPILDELSEALEVSLAEVHSPITHDERCQIILARPRVGDVLLLDQSSLDYLKNQVEDTQRFTISANVTKFNLLSGYGRLYSDIDGEIISFKLEHNEDQRVRDLVIKSMSQKSGGNAGKMNFLVTATRSVHGIVKKYKVFDVLEKRG